MQFFSATQLPEQVTFTRPSIRTRLNSTGQMVTLSNNQPGFQHSRDSLLERLGLAIEPASTNLILSSQQMLTSTDGWGVNNSATITPNASTFYGLNVSRVERVTTSDNNVIGAKATIPISGLAVGTTINISVFVKNNGGIGSCRLYVSENTTGGSPASQTGNRRFDLTNDITRYVLPYTIQTAGRDSLTVYLASTQTGSSPYDFYCGLWQVEVGPAATSYIPTAGASVTRQPDTAIVPTIAPWFYPIGTTFADFILTGLPASGAVAPIVTFDDDSELKTIGLQVTSAGVLQGVVTSGGSTVTVDAGIVNIGHNFINRAAFTFSGGTLTVKLNEGGPLSQAVTFPTGLTKMRLGTNKAAAYMQGILRDIEYWPTVITSTSLASMTNRDYQVNYELDFVGNSYKLWEGSY